MQLDGITIHLIRTVRVPEGDHPALLPPSLGMLPEYPVADFPNCPPAWEKDGLFVPLHDGEAMWMSFRPTQPCALVVGAGGINAVTGELLTPALSPDSYLVAPPQPWLDGWKGEEDAVYQFVATPFEAGEGHSVGEQLRGKECLSGGLGVAVFHAKPDAKLAPYAVPREGKVLGGQTVWASSVTLGGQLPPLEWVTQDAQLAAPSAGVGEPSEATPQGSLDEVYALVANQRLRYAQEPPKEIALGRGGAIQQKIYPDPHGITAWKEEPVQRIAVYLVDAARFAVITGKPLPAPVGHERYHGPAFTLADGAHADTKGSGKFQTLTPVPKGDAASDTFPGGQHPPEKTKTA